MLAWSPLDRGGYPSRNTSSHFPTEADAAAPPPWPLRADTSDNGWPRMHERYGVGGPSTDSAPMDPLLTPGRQERHQPPSTLWRWLTHSPSSETDPSQEPYWHDATPLSGDDGVDAATPRGEDQALASDGFKMVKLVASTDTYDLDYRAWIGSVHGTPVTVPANGQCLFLAFHATTTNTQTKKLTLRRATVAAADLVKQRVLDIVLAKLRYDVKLRLILPKEELQRLYPGEAPPATQEAAAAMLYTHYVKMREVSVGISVPRTLWEGPTVLRVMAVYLREPVYVWLAQCQQASSHFRALEILDRGYREVYHGD
ncbi:unnamed protein product [Phytophthora fragariaefolia]|uniref:Unnamed protein product n=1 Tax=Phytophthora fragariaefolia TaxID=1490495 RepID=A0A9W6WIX5_9STRA|nr:unnamed protein product [Phytophthora fragariaefolia]